MQTGHQMKIRLPSDVKAWVEDQANRYGGSLNGEVVRSIRERMERDPKSASGGVAPPPKTSPEA